MAAEREDPRSISRRRSATAAARGRESVCCIRMVSDFRMGRPAFTIVENCRENTERSFIFGLLRRLISRETPGLWAATDTGTSPISRSRLITSCWLSATSVPLESLPEESRTRYLNVSLILDSPLRERSHQPFDLGEVVALGPGGLPGDPAVGHQRGQGLVHRDHPVP